MTGLQARLLLAVGVLALAAAAAVGFSVREGTRLELVRFEEAEHRLVTDLKTVREDVLARLGSRCCAADVVAAAARALDRRTGLFVIGAADGQTIASAGPPLATLTNVTLHREPNGIRIEFTRVVAGRVEQLTVKLRQDGVPLRLDDGRAGLLYLVPFPEREREARVEAFLGAVDRRLVLAIVLVGLLAIGVTWVIARSIARPIDELRLATRDLSGGALTRRVTPRGGAEVAELGRAFNAMAGELERQQALRRDLVHDVAHELRTPLTALRCRLETVMDGLAPDPGAAVRDLHEDVLHLGRLVDDLQVLALAEARELPLAVGPVVLAPVAGSSLRAAGIDGDPRVELSVDAALVVQADAGRLRQVLTNLLTNAERHTPAEGRIEVAARAEGARVVITVRNTGSTLDADQRARVFDRLYRTDPSRQRGTGGTGLGLAIVKQFVEAMGGEVGVESDAAGVRFLVTLPAPHAADPRGAHLGEGA